jgi:excisionase family DNA binding protein
MGRRKEAMRKAMSEAETGSEVEEAYLTIKEAAQILGVSLRSVYGYVEEGKLKGERVGTFLMVKENEVREFKRRAPGRICSATPRWRASPATNRSYATTIVARVRPGQGKVLEEKVVEWRKEKKHVLEGTSARYVVRDQARPEEVEIVLIWREVIMPKQARREAALVALREDLVEVLEWETAMVNEGKVLLHT